MASPRILALRQEWSQTDEAGTNITNVDSEFGQPRELNKELYDNLFKNSPKRYIVSSSPKCFAAIHKEDFTENFYISDEELEAYAQGVLDILTTENIGAVEIQQDEEAQVDLDDIALLNFLYTVLLNLFTINGFLIVEKALKNNQLKVIFLITMDKMMIEHYLTILNL